MTQHEYGLACMVHLGPLRPSGAALQTGLKIFHMSDMTQPAYIILNSCVLCMHMESELRYMAVFDHLVSLYNTLLSLVNQVCKERHLCCLNEVPLYSTACNRIPSIFLYCKHTAAITKAYCLQLCSQFKPTYNTSGALRTLAPDCPRDDLLTSKLWYAT